MELAFGLGRRRCVSLAFYFFGGWRKRAFLPGNHIDTSPNSLSQGNLACCEEESDAAALEESVLPDDGELRG